jgi:hypothetical protein
VEGEGELNKRVVSGVDVEEGGNVKGRLVEGLVDGLVDGDADEDEGWNENPEGLVEKLGGLVDEVEDG